MNILKQTAAEQQKITDFLDESGAFINRLEPYGDCLDLSELKHIRDSFKAKTDDFNSSERKLNIGIIGQVKAGKSTFLNTLLFGGREVLPAAKTPKTAVLTRIEYSEENSILIEYYSAEEWEVLEKLAAADSAINEAAKEIIGMVSERGIDPQDFISRKTERIDFDSADDLMGRLNGYVGEDGQYTPLVKNVTLHLNIDDLKEICVVDTPGLNDAIASRTDKTREFIENCDVVFFLSYASHFLDANDMKLVTSQLPAKGVENIILICSLFDSGVKDKLNRKRGLTISDYEKAADRVVAELIEQTNGVMEAKFREAETSHFSQARMHIFEQLKKPVFVSSFFENMRSKSISDYTRSEKDVYDKLLKKGIALTPEVMTKYSGFDIVRKKYEAVVAQKDNTLQSKAMNFVPNVKAEWKTAVSELKNMVKSRINTLETGDRETLKKQQQFMQSQISGIKLSLENVLGELLIALETAKADNLRKIRQNSIEASKIQEKTGEEWHTSRYKVTTGILWWKESHYETSSYSTTYTYLETSDALENIRSFGYDACSDIESAFLKAVDIRNVKRRLATTILENFDSSDENFDINYFRHIIESTLNKLEFPVVKIDIEPFLSSISSKFSGEVTNSSERSELKSLLSSTINKMFDEISAIFTSEVSSFKKHIENIKEQFSDVILENINSDFELLKRQFDDKENEIARYRQIIDMLDN